jgi:hypothetical protein
MPKTSPTDYKKIKPGRLTVDNYGKPYVPSRGGVNPRTGEYVKKGSLTQRPRLDPLTHDSRTGKPRDIKKSPARTEMLSDRQIKMIQGKKPGVLTKIKAKIYALQGKTPRGNKTSNIGPLFKTDSTKGKIPKTRQVRPRTISPIDGKPIRPTGGGGAGRGGSRSEFRSFGGGGGEGGILRKKIR